MSFLRNVAWLALAALLVQGTPAAAEEEIISRIKRETVISSNVASIGYSRDLRALEIEFKRGAIYRFLDVPRGLYRELMASDSKGHFIAEHLRGRYRFVRVRLDKSASRSHHEPR